MADNFDKIAILDSFIDEVSAYLPEIEANLDRLQQSPADMTALEETYRRAHTIGGSAAMMDFTALAQVAQGMEEALGDALDAQRPLDGPTIALLRRSYARMTRLLDSIRAGAEDAAIAGEDERDRSAIRGPIAPGAESGGSTSAPLGGMSTTGRPGTTGGLQIPEWLAAFAQNGASSGAVATPNGAPSGPTTPGASAAGASSPGAEAPGTSAPGERWAASLSELPTGRAPAMPGATSRPPSGTPSSPGTEPWDRSGAFAPPAQSSTPSTPAMPGALPAFGSQPGQPASFGAAESSGSMVWEQPTNPNIPVPPSPAQVAAAGETNGLAVTALDEVRVDAEAVRRQVASLQDVVASLREAAQHMEDERAELRGFLDGSQDALERLEEWAGRQMGLDLLNSPEHVRRYLPLSVIWVVSARLKKMVALLHGSGRGLTATQEQIEETLDELRGALDAFGQLYSSVAAVGGTPEGGFSATVAQMRWSPPAMGESSAARAREVLSPGTRAEMERTVREDLRRELEDEVRDEIAAEVRRDEEQRLRHELEIQVRRQVLSELAPGLGASGALSISGGPAPAPRMPFAEGGPRPVRVTSEQSPEALEVFRDEAQEHLQTITTGITQLERTPGDADALRSIRRAMHTLKGAAGMMGFTPIQDLAHACEDLLDALDDGNLQFSPRILSVILDASEALDHIISGGISRQEDQQRTVQPLIQRAHELSGLPATAAGTAVNPPTPATGVTIRGADRDVGNEPPATDLSVRLQLSKLDELVTIFGELLISRSAHEERLDRLNHLISDTGRVSERLRDIGGQLETSFEAATLPSGSSASMMPGLNGNAQANRFAGRPMSSAGYGQPSMQAGEFDPLELDQYTEFHRLTRGLAEAVVDVGTLSREMETLIREIQTSFARETRLGSDFQDRLLKARLVPLQSLVTRLYRAARASALRESKEIDFFMEGGETEVDRKVFEEIEGPLLHIVRNAVNHGIERPDERERAGKPRAGRLVVSAAYEGNQVAIAVQDDGAGIDPERLRQAAIARGLIDRSTVLSQREAIDLIFRPGMTTAESVTEESGRGVGLDVVRDVVNRLRGTVEVESTPGQGSTFTLKFPISLQIARAVLVRAGQQVWAVPMTAVSQIGRLDYYARVPGQTPMIEVRGERYPVVHLAQYLSAQPGPVSDRSAVLLINAGKHRVAMLVDDILSQQEIVSKPLGPHLVDVPGISGASVMGNGQVVLILEMHELLSQRPTSGMTLPAPGTRAAPDQLPTAPLTGSIPGDASSWGIPRRSVVAPALSTPSGNPAPPFAAGQSFVVTPRGGAAQHHVVVPPNARHSYILVVDDSPSVRRVVSGMLKAHGWNVQTARDGIEALELIARERPAAVLLDIEMPRMDGYELMATIRSQEQYRTLPLIVLTSRAATKHKSRAIQLGADDYVVKPYQDDDLLSRIAALVQAQG